LPVIINGQTYYRTAEVCLIVGIGKTTLFRWINEGVVKEAEHRDRRGWRLFTENEIYMLKAEVNGIRKTSIVQVSTE
jgi:predicted site-specific integrase-resolvase